MANCTLAPARAFLDWPLITDPARWVADIALIGIQHSEPYSGEANPNDQSRAPDAIRLASGQFSDGREYWSEQDVSDPAGSSLCGPISAPAMGRGAQDRWACGGVE